MKFLGEMENDMGALGMLNISFLDQWTSFNRRTKATIQDLDVGQKAKELDF